MNIIVAFGNFYPYIRLKKKICKENSLFYSSQVTPQNEHFDWLKVWIKSHISHRSLNSVEEGPVRRPPCLMVSIIGEHGCCKLQSMRCCCQRVEGQKLYWSGRSILAPCSAVPISFFKVSQNRQNFHPGKTYQYVSAIQVFTFSLKIELVHKLKKYNKICFSSLIIFLAFAYFL